MNPTAVRRSSVSSLSFKRRQVGIADVHGARGQRVETGEAVHQRALARPRRAHDRRELAGLERDGDAVEGTHLAVALAVDLHRIDRARRRAGRQCLVSWPICINTERGVHHSDLVTCVR